MNSFSLLNDFIIPGTIIVAQILAVIMPVLISVAFLVYAERKVLALIQLRRGPNVVGPFGILQSFADALKLLTKENIVPSNSNKARKFLFSLTNFFLTSLRLLKSKPQLRRSLKTLNIFHSSFESPKGL